MWSRMVISYLSRPVLPKHNDSNTPRAEVMQAYIGRKTTPTLMSLSTDIKSV